MADIDALKSHLLALQKAGQSKATVDINWLLSCLSSMEKTVQPQYAPVRSSTEFDGGTFGDGMDT